MPRQFLYDVVVIGGGPAGLMAAITAASNGLRVLLLEGEECPGKKLLVTGGGHCNITHREVSEKDFNSGVPRVVRNVLRSFQVREMKTFFQKIGVLLVCDSDGKMFPETRKAATVLYALLRTAGKLGIKVETGKKAERIKFHQGHFSVEGHDFDFFPRTVIIATGGLSYPSTGSRGSGFEIARAFGHAIVPTAPALVPFRTDDSDWHSLAGITLEVKLRLVCNDRVEFSSQGALLFTHEGFSGPVAMDLSSAWIKSKGRSGVFIEADFLPSIREEKLRREIVQTVSSNPAISIKTFLGRYFPERFTVVFLEKIKVELDKQMAHCSRSDRESIIRHIRAFHLPITETFGYDKAEVTAGGVDLKEVDSKTLASKIVPGLFFAGEVLDVDGRIGGFNLHWAWASGHTVGQAVADYCRRDNPL